MMKSVLMSIFCVLVMTAHPVMAEDNVQNEIEVLKDYAEADRKAIITLNVDLTAKESKDFWPVYNQYRNDMKTVNDRLISLVQKYADSYENLSDKAAAEMMSEAMDIEQDRQIYKRIYVEDLTDILPMKKVAVLFQIENKIEAAVKYELSLAVPMLNLTQDSEKK